jgi:hypothetical protein
MPRYYFVIIQNGSRIEDDTGTELDDIGSARAHAYRIIGELRQDESFRQGAWEMIVTGSDKREVFRIPFPKAGELGR